MSGSLIRADLAHADLARRHLMFRIGRRLLGERPLFDGAEKAWEIAPAESVRFRPSVALEGQFEKIRSVETNTTWEIERRRAFGSEFARKPVRAFRFSNAMLYKGSVFAAGRGRRILPEPANAPPSKNFPVLDIDQGALAGSWLGLRYFGHWLSDDVPLSLLAEQYGDPVSPTPPVWHPGAHRNNHVDAYARYLDLKWRAAENVRFKSLIVFDDEEITTHKAERIRALRERVRKRRGAYPSRKGLFIMRGVRDAPPRTFLNEEAVAEALEREGYDILAPAVMTVEEIAEASYGAETIIGMEGSQINHALYFAKDGARMLAITPPDRFNSLMKQWAELIGMRYGYITGDPAQEGFTANIDDIHRTIDLFDREKALA